MKVLIITATLDERCGGGRYSWQLVKRLTERKGLSLRVAVADKSGKQGEEISLPQKGNIFKALWVMIRLRLYAQGMDIIHCFDGYPVAIYGHWCVIGTKKKLLINGVGTLAVLPFARIHEHGWSLKEWLKTALLKSAYRRADKVISISHYTKKQIEKSIPEVIEKHEVVFLGVDQQRFVGTPRDGVGKTVRILSVGALKWRKGQHLTVEAIALLIKEMPDTRLTIIGAIESRGYHQMLLKRVQELRIEDKVTFLHDLDDTQLYRQYELHDIFVMPSVQRGEHFEGFGLVYLEAGLMGLPSIGSKDTGAEDAIKNGETGLLVPQNDPRAIADAIKKIIQDDDQYKRLSHAALSFSRTFTWEKTVESICRLYGDKVG